MNAFCVIVGPIRAENGSQGDDQPATQQNDGEERVIFVNAPHQPAKYKNNHITTAKYSFLSFVPLFLFEQFRRYSNCFFLFIALMQVKFVQKYYEHDTTNMIQRDMIQRTKIRNSLIIFFHKFFLSKRKDLYIIYVLEAFFFNLNFQQIPDVSPTGRWTTLVPLIFILSVSALKEIIEDVVRIFVIIFSL